MTSDPHPYASASQINFNSPSGSPLRRPRGLTYPRRTDISTLPSKSSQSGNTSNLDLSMTFPRLSLIDDRRPSEPDSLFLDMSDGKESEYDSEEERRKEKEKERRNEKRGRRRGVATHGVGVEALLRAAETCGRPAPQSYAPEVVHDNPWGGIDADSASISLTIEELTPCFPHPPFSPFPFSISKGGKEANENPETAQQHSPASSVSSYSPSTPVLPLTPASSDESLSLPTVAPLSVSKSATASGSTSKVTQEKRKHSLSTTSPQRTLHGSRNRFSARTSSLASVARVFAPLDTVAANNLDLSLGIAQGDLTLTGMLEEVRREAERNRAEREREELEDNHDDDGAWVDIDHEADDEAAREFYRADIATHLQLFSNLSPFSPRMYHRRNGSSSSQNGIPPARPDSLPPPPHFKPPSDDLPPIPTSHLSESACTVQQSQSYSGLRRASASSLASNASGRSTQSNRSTRSTRSTGSSKGKSVKKRISRARLSAVVAMKKRASRPLPPIPVEETVKAPSALLDPTYTSARPFCPEQKPAPKPGKELSRRAPRFSLPVDVEDVFGDHHAVKLSKVKGMSTLREIDEEACLESTSKHGKSDEESVDPLMFSSRSEAPSDIPQSPAPFSPLSPSFSSPNLTPGLSDGPMPLRTPTFLLTPHSSINESNHDDSTFDAESLYSPMSTNRSDFELGTETDSIYHDGEGRVLRSRWSVSTFASSAAPSKTSSAASSFSYSKFALLIPQKAQRLQARLKGVREKSVQQSKDARAKAKAQREEMPTVGTPFFPRPRAPSPKRKNNPGPGRYIPKPELMPPSQRPSTSSNTSLSEMSTATPRSSCETHISTSSSSGSSRSSSSSQFTITKRDSPQYPYKASRGSISSPTHKDIATQFAQFREHRHSPEHAAHDPRYSSRSSVNSRTGLLASTSNSRARANTDGIVPHRMSTRESLSAFPFTIVGCDDHVSGSEGDAVSEDGISSRKSSESLASIGLRRKPIPFSFGRG